MTNQYDATKVAEIEARRDAATPGPWRWGDWDQTFGYLERPEQRNVLEFAPAYDDAPSIRLPEHKCKYIIRAEDNEVSGANREFLAAVWTDIGYLLGVAKAQQKEIAILEACNDSLGHPVDSPCGHSSIYAVSDDGGANIQCLRCRESKLESEVARLKEENERSHETRREQSRIIRGWQQHAERTAKLLGCIAIDEKIETAVERLR